MNHFDLRAHWRTLKGPDRAKFAAIAKTSVAYLDVSVTFRRKFPRPKLMRRIANACNQTGATLCVTEVMLVAWFYARPPQSRIRRPRGRPKASAIQNVASSNGGQI